MTFNVNAFRALALRDGLARPNLFEVQITNAPPGIADGALQNASLLIQAAELPGSYVGKTVVPYMGRTIPIAGNREFADWRITIMNDEDFGLRNLFEAWHNKINSIQSNRQDSTENLMDYLVDAEVLQYGKAGPGDESGVIRAYKFVGMWPTQIDPIPLGWDRNNTYESFDVTMAYAYWEPSDFGGGPGYSVTTPPDPTQS